MQHSPNIPPQQSPDDHPQPQAAAGDAGAAPTRSADHRRARALHNYLTDLAHWETGEGAQVDATIALGPAGPLAYLRWNPITRMVETSEGIQFPEPLARSVWIHTRAVLRYGPLFADYSILNYPADEISRD